VQYEVEINGRTRQVTVNRAGGGFTVAVDGRPFHVDAARVDDHTLSLVIGEEIRLKEDTTAATQATAAPEAGTATEPVASGLSRAVSSGHSRDVASGFSRTRAYEVTIAADAESSHLAVRVGATSLVAAVNGRRRPGRRDDGPHSGTGPQRVVAPMPGKIVRVLVQNGQTVVTRQPLVVVEAMKMENELRAGRDGTVAEIHAQEGQSVDAGALLAIIQ
jgi:biotin carboxyl carrier protein